MSADNEHRTRHWVHLIAIANSSGANNAKIARLQKEVDELKSAVHRSRSPRMRPRQKALPQSQKMLALRASQSKDVRPWKPEQEPAKRSVVARVQQAVQTGGKDSGKGKGVMSFDRIMDTLGSGPGIFYVPPFAQRNVLQISEGRMQHCFSLREETFLRRLWCRRQALQLLPLFASNVQLTRSSPKINKKIKANDKFWKILTNMPVEHRALNYGESFKSKMQSLDDEKTALLAARRQFLPLQSRIEKQKNYLERVSKEIESKQKKRLEILQKWIEADQELEAANAKQMQAKQEMALLVAEQSAENAKKLSVKGIQGFSLTCQDKSLIKLHNTPFSQCSNPFSRCKAWGVTVFRNTPWRLAQPRRMSRKSVRLCPRRVVSRAKWWARTKSSPMYYAYLDSAKWTPKAKKPSRGVCQTPSQKRCDWRRNASRKEKVCSLLRLWIWTHCSALLSCAFQNW